MIKMAGNKLSLVQRFVRYRSSRKVHKQADDYQMANALETIANHQPSDKVSDGYIEGHVTYKRNRIRGAVMTLSALTLAAVVGPEIAENYGIIVSPLEASVLGAGVGYLFHKIIPKMKDKSVSKKKEIYLS